MYGPTRDESKALYYQDFDAIRKAQSQGLRVGLLSAQSGSWPEFVAERLGADLLVAGEKDKAQGLTRMAERLGVSTADICYVGDGDRDAPALRLAGRGYAPANGTPNAKRAAHRVLMAAGGR